MMKKLQISWIIVAMLLFITACGGGGDDDTTPVLKLKATSNDVSMVAGDAIGIFMTYGTLQQTGNYLDNLRMHTDGSSWIMEKTCSWKDKTSKADFYAYAPYNAVLLNPLAYAFSVNEDQSTVDKQKTSDLLWCKLDAQSSTASVLTLTMKRLLARLAIKVEAGEGVTTRDLSDGTLMICINGVQNQAIVNLQDGTIQSKGDKGSIVPLLEKELLYSAILVPQKVEGEGLVKVSWNGADYTLSKSMTFDSGKQYTLSVKINQSAGSVNIGITQWEIIDEDYGGTVY